MSNKSAHSDRDFSRFDAMSTEELNAILYQDSLLPSEQETDTDAILYIMEVIAKREAMEHSEDSPSTEEALSRFNALYRTEDGDGKSLYEEDDEETMPVLSAAPTPPTEYKKPRKNIRFVTRAAIVAAILCVILLGSSLIASASGFNLWTALAQWGRETFGFTNSAAGIEASRIYPEDNDPRDTLIEYGVSEPLLPTWMPDGYEFQKIEFMETPARAVFHLKYTNGEQWIGMSIAVLSTVPVLAHEKDEEDTAVYHKNGIDHYIIKNLGETTAAWTVGVCECSIRGPISVEEIRNIIDSIYRS